MRSKYDLVTVFPPGYSPPGFWSWWASPRGNYSLSQQPLSRLSNTGQSGYPREARPVTEARERCPKCGDLLVVESEDPLEEFCINGPCDYYRADGLNGVICE